jgi:hypothetical protein
MDGDHAELDGILAVHLNPDKPETNNKSNTEEITQNKKAA